MDIFTTQLTRVLPVPIKPTSLKVKALLKDAASGKLKDDHDHLENHDYYFISSKSEQEKEQHQLSKSTKLADADNSEQENKEEGPATIKGKDHQPHLDIFV